MAKRARTYSSVTSRPGCRVRSRPAPGSARATNAGQMAADPLLQLSLAAHSATDRSGARCGIHDRGERAYATGRTGPWTSHRSPAVDAPSTRSVNLGPVGLPDDDMPRAAACRARSGHDCEHPPRNFAPRFVALVGKGPDAHESWLSWSRHLCRARGQSAPPLPSRTSSRCALSEQGLIACHDARVCGKRIYTFDGGDRYRSADQEGGETRECGEKCCNLRFVAARRSRRHQSPRRTGSWASSASCQRCGRSLEALFCLAERPSAASGARRKARTPAAGLGDEKRACLSARPLKRHARPAAAGVETGAFRPDPLGPFHCDDVFVGALCALHVRTTCACAHARSRAHRRAETPSKVQASKTPRAVVLIITSAVPGTLCRRVLCRVAAARATCHRCSPRHWKRWVQYMKQ